MAPSGLGGGVLGVHLGDDGPHGDGGALLCQYPGKRSGEWRGHFHIYLVRDDLNQGIVFLDLVSGLLQPLLDDAFNDGFADLGKFDGYDRHEYTSSRLPVSAGHP